MDNTLSPQLEEAQVIMSFYDALKEVQKGNRITRLSWNDESEYGFVENDFLTIHTKGAFHQWLVSVGDMEATDWVVLGKVQNG